MDGLMTVVAPLFVVGATLGWMLLLNRRDRRREGLLNAVFRELSSRDLRGRVAVRVRSGVLSPWSVVAVDVLAASEKEMWQIMERLAERLSHPVRVEVTGRVDPHFVTTLAVETAGGQSRPHSSRSCPAAA